MKIDPVPYAEALLRTSKVPERIARQLDALTKILDQAPLAGQLLTDAAGRSAAERTRLIKKMLKGLDLQLQYLLDLLVTERALPILPDIRDAFRRAHLRAAGLTPVTVETAEPLTPAERRRLIVQLSARGYRPALTERVKPDLIGGLRLMVEDVEHDFSLGGTLDRIEQGLVTA